MSKTLVREWACLRGVSRRMRHLAYDWGKVYSNLLLNTDNGEVLVRDAKNRLKILMEKATDEKARRDLRYELRFLRWFWKYSNSCDCCDCCDCNGCDFSSLDSAVESNEHSRV